ncbi:HNH endonuclease [Aureispira sp. CCB-QB1]|uniref:HNH endonuclease n=1 Tax=Aureispira sp. CCB-QB1 TaxID=1313421 RepID=UPI000907B55D
MTNFVFCTKQKCRFCGIEESVVSFSIGAHVLPKLLGENNFTSNFECDDCNSKFSKYESHLTTLFLSSLSIMHIRKKRKVPIF